MSDNLLNKLWNPLTNEFEKFSKGLLDKYLRDYVNNTNTSDTLSDIANTNIKIMTGGARKTKKTKKTKNNQLTAVSISKSQKYNNSGLLANIYDGYKEEDIDTIYTKIRDKVINKSLSGIVTTEGNIDPTPDPENFQFNAINNIHTYFNTFISELKKKDK
jgi:hypothetical protein